MSILWNGNPVSRLSQLAPNKKRSLEIHKRFPDDGSHKSKTTTKAKDQPTDQTSTTKTFIKHACLYHDCFRSSSSALRVRLTSTTRSGLLSCSNRQTLPIPWKPSPPTSEEDASLVLSILMELAAEKAACTSSIPELVPNASWAFAPSAALGVSVSGRQRLFVSPCLHISHCSLCSFSMGKQLHVVRGGKGLDSTCFSYRVALLPGCVYYDAHRFVFTLQREGNHDREMKQTYGGGSTDMDKLEYYGSCSTSTSCSSHRDPVGNDLCNDKNTWDFDSYFQKYKCS